MDNADHNADLLPTFAKASVGRRRSTRGSDPRGDQRNGSASGSAVRGFTLVEVLVAIGIMAILTALVGAAIPRIRTHQALISDTQQLRSFMRDAQQRALNEVREDDCLTLVASMYPGNDDALKLCSNVGLALREDTVTMFADLDGDRLYNDDYDIQVLGLSSHVQADHDIVFESDPPTFEVWADGTFVGVAEVIPVVLTLDGTEKRLEVHSFGQLEEL